MFPIKPNKFTDRTGKVALLYKKIYQYIEVTYIKKLNIKIDDNGGELNE